MKFTLLVTFLSIIFYFGCSQDPSSVGKNLLLDSDKLMTDTLTITSEKSSSYPITTSNNSPTLMVGRSNGVVAEMLLQFGPFVVDTAIANSIISVKIKMLPNYSFKDTTGTMAVSMHRMPIPWNESTFNADSLTTYDINPIDVPSIAINSRDSLIEFPLDNSIVSNWLKGEKNNGIILVPKLSSDIILGVTSYVNSTSDDRRPQIEILYRLPADTADKTLTLRTVQDATIFSGVRPTSSDSLFYVQGGLIERGKIFFDVDSIPKSA
ncbi:MAG: DNRLRE domain-containing protein, partial [Bacteroidetes bacterium]|nr:DNRLRE domain-containing protein [Bacteroidota bacterium]